MGSVSPLTEASVGALIFYALVTFVVNTNWGIAPMQLQGSEPSSQSLCLELMCVRALVLRPVLLSGRVVLSGMLFLPPPHSEVLVGSGIDSNVFDYLPKDPGSICASVYNPMLNPTQACCRSVSDEPSK